MQDTEVLKSRVSIIIPTLNAEKEIRPLIEKLLSQTCKPDEIIIIDSSSDDATERIVKDYSQIIFLKIDRQDFNHGLTRDKAIKESSGEIICFLTQDAIPANNYFLENLVRPIIDNDDVAISSGRQLPKPDARRFEQLVRAYNYPPESCSKTQKDIAKLGIKTYFVTDVCAAYRRDIYFNCGGFEKTDMNEDMLMAAKVINSGWKVVYAANAEVYHSHNLSLGQQFQRNRAIGRFLQSRSDIFGNISEFNEGSQLAKKVLKQLLIEREVVEAVMFCVDCISRFCGNRAGRNDIKR